MLTHPGADPTIANKGKRVNMNRNAPSTYKVDYEKYKKIDQKEKIF